MARFWASFWDKPDHPPLHILKWPHWYTGFRFDGSRSVCVALIARSKAHAKELLASSYESPVDDLEWRFLEQKPDDWCPFTDRFPRADWMEWF